MCFGGKPIPLSFPTPSLSPPVIQEFLQRFETNVFLIVFLSVPEKVSTPFFFFHQRFIFLFTFWYFPPSPQNEAK
jgi:hypothetical protein